MVTHDRYFLDRIVDRIVEIDRRQSSTQGGYSEFLEQQATRLEAETNTEQNRLSTIRRETQWIRRGAHGRTTKEKARVQRYRADGPRKRRWKNAPTCNSRFRRSQTWRQGDSH